MHHVSGTKQLAKVACNLLVRSSDADQVFLFWVCFQAMARIGAREHASLFVPVSIAQYSVYEALAAELMPPGCHNCTLSAADVRALYLASVPPLPRSRL
jgi:hypothetical protein